jgi:hypothetical protein
MISSSVIPPPQTGSITLENACSTERHKRSRDIQQVLPIPSTDVDFTKNELEPFLNNRQNQPLAVPWDTLQSYTKDLSTTEESIGPGETDNITVDFIISTDVKVAMVFGYFEKNNPGCKSNSDGTLSGTGMISRAIYKMSDDASGGN